MERGDNPFEALERTIISLDRRLARLERRLAALEEAGPAGRERLADAAAQTRDATAQTRDASAGPHGAVSPDPAPPAAPSLGSGPGGPAAMPPAPPPAHPAAQGPITHGVPGWPAPEPPAPVRLATAQADAAPPAQTTAWARAQPAAGRPVALPPGREPAPPAGPDWDARRPVEDAPPPRPPVSLKDLEDRFAGQALAWVGGFALVAAAVFFLSLAFSRGWITEPMRVLVGLAAGSAAFAGGAVLLARRNAVVGNVLTGVGLGVVAIALMAATRLYGLVPPEVGLLGALLAAAAAAAIAVRFDARSVATYGLIAALAAPPLTDAPPTLVTVAFIAIALAGTTAISLYRSWRWLPGLAFALASPQLASWVAGDADATQAIVALAGFWLVNTVAAAGEEVRIRRDDLRPSSATLVLANGVFLVWGLFAMLDGDLEAWLGGAVLTASVAHVLVGGWFLARQGLAHLFGNLVAGTGIALLALAMFVALGAPMVPVAWAAEAAALAWLAVRRRHAWSAGAALVLGGLAVSHLLVVEYPFGEAGIPADILLRPPFLHPEGGSLAAVVLGIGVVAALVPVRWVRSALAGLAMTLAAYASTFELAGPALGAALVAIALAGIAIDRVIAVHPPRGETLEPVGSWIGFGWFAAAASVPVGTMAVVLLFATELPPASLGTVAAVPFANPGFLSLLVVLAGLGIAGALVPVGWIRSALGGVGILLAAWALPFQVSGVELVGALAVLLPAAVILDRALARLPDGQGFDALARVSGVRLAASAAGAVAWCAAFAYATLTVLDPRGWGGVARLVPPFVDEPLLAGALLAGATLAAARWLVPVEGRRAAVLATIAVCFLVVPFEVPADLVVVLWVTLGGCALLAAAWDRGGRPWYMGAAAALWVAAALVAFVVVAVPSRLWIPETAEAARPALPGLWPLAFTALAVSAGLAPRLVAFARLRVPLEVGAGSIALYALSIAIVDAFGGRVGGTVATEELAKQAQVALSVCWTVVGVAALIVGLATRRSRPRQAGLALLALATVKVFAIDLASMDVAYRALVLGGLGLLLLASAWLFTRFRTRPPEASGGGATVAPDGEPAD